MRKFKSFKFLVIVLSFAFCVLSLPNPAFAQTGCITTGTAIGTRLLSTPTLTGNFVTSSGACIIDPRAASTPYTINGNISDSLTRSIPKLAS